MKPSSLDPRLPSQRAQIRAEAMASKLPGYWVERIVSLCAALDEACEGRRVALGGIREPTQAEQEPRVTVSGEHSGECLLNATPGVVVRRPQGQMGPTDECRGCSGGVDCDILSYGGDCPRRGDSVKASRGTP